MIRTSLLFAVMALSAAVPLDAQSLLQSGPMVGAAELREVTLWAQTTRAATVQVRYWLRDDPARSWLTSPVTTVADSAFVAHLHADSVEPGRRYVYALRINGSVVPRPYPLEFQTPALWQWRTDAPDFTIAVGSCNYVNEPDYDRPGTPYGAGHEIFASIHRLRPDLMLWLGDNTYLREADWYSWSGILRRNTHTRSLPELQPLLASTSHYAIWDDHDFGPNNSDRGFRERAATLAAFKLFWCNPEYGTPELPGIFTSFEWSDVEFFLLDNRTFRSPDRRRTGDRQIIGAAQMQALLDRLVSSQARFKIIAIGGQVLNPHADGENWSAFPDELQRLLDTIRSENISGVVFLSGDRHMTELTRLPREGTYALHDLTVSPFTAGPYAKGESEPNTLRVPGTWVGQRNFATLSFTGPRTDRVMTIRVFDTGGRELWAREIRAAEVRETEFR